MECYGSIPRAKSFSDSNEHNWNKQSDTGYRFFTSFFSTIQLHFAFSMSKICLHLSESIAVQMHIEHTQGSVSAKTQKTHKSKLWNWCFNLKRANLLIHCVHLVSIHLPEIKINSKATEKYNKETKIEGRANRSREWIDEEKLLKFFIA